MDIIQAKQGKSIDHATDSEISACLAYICTLVGITNLPDTTAKGILLSALRRHFPTYTINELTLAFELALTDKINVDLNHYNNLDFMYVSKVLSKYREYKASVMMYVPDLESLPEMTESQRIQKDIEAVKFFFDRYKQDKKTFLPGKDMCIFLDRQGVDLLNGKKWSYYRNLGKQEVEKQKQSMKDKFNLFELATFKADPDLEGAKFLLRDYFDRVIKSGGDVL